MQLFCIVISFLFLILFFSSISVIIHLKRKSKDLSYHTLMVSQEKDLVLSFFHRIGEAFSEALDLDELLKLIIDFSRQTTKAKAGAIFFLEGNFLSARIVDGIFPPLYASTLSSLGKIASKVKYLNENLKREKIALGDGIIGRVAEKKRPLLIQKAENHQDIPKTNIDFLQIKTLMAVPLRFKNEIIGVMVAVNKLDSDAFSETDLSLFESLADLASVSIHNARLYQNIFEKERIDRELKIANEIQNLLLPETFPEIKKFEIAAFSDPALEVGGDYFDFITMDNRIGVVIADVSGKGIPGALIMVMYRSILRTISLAHDSPANILSLLNSQMFPDMRYDMFISSTFGFLDAHSSRFISARAGHEPIIYYNKKEDTVSLVKGKGIVIGIDKGPLFEENIENTVLTLQKGDIIVLYTDGITEAVDKDNNEFGIENLINTITISSKLSAAEIAKNIKQRIQRFTGTTPQHDDLTGIIIKAR